MADIYDSYLNLINDEEQLKKLKSDKTSSNKNTDESINGINKQIIKNENQKRKFKRAILWLVSILTFIQLIFFNVVVAFVVASITVEHSFLKELDIKIISEMLDFLKYYIGATIVELLGMLLFIMRYVFSDTINKHLNKKQK